MTSVMRNTDFRDKVLLYFIPFLYFDSSSTFDHKLLCWMVTKTSEIDELCKRLCFDWEATTRK